MLSCRFQNTVAGLVFAVLLASAASMQLLSYFPASGALWYININYAREARPVLELMDFLPFAGPVQNMLIIVGLIGLCGLAVHTKKVMLTSATTHIALYAAIFAGGASFSRTFGTLESASLATGDVREMAVAMDPSQLALIWLLILLLASCLFHHYQIVSDVIREGLSKSDS
ncbi:MAG: hypothetical protein ACR2PS_07230 [Pseudomonadales bacterium]